MSDPRPSRVFINKETLTITFGALDRIATNVSRIRYALPVTPLTIYRVFNARH